MAYHEAAHGVVAHKLGLSCARIHMVPVDGVTTGAVTSSASHVSGEQLSEKIRGFELDGMVALAGPVANVRCSGNIESFTDGAESDLALAQSAAASIAHLEAGLPLPTQGGEMKLAPSILQAASTKFDLLLTRVEALVAESWPTIDRVAAALMKSDHMTAAEFEELMISGQARSGVD